MVSSNSLILIYSAKFDSQTKSPSKCTMNGMVNHQGAQLFQNLKFLLCSNFVLDLVCLDYTHNLTGLHQIIFGGSLLFQYNITYLNFYSSLLFLSNTLRQSGCAEFQTFLFLKNMVAAFTKPPTPQKKERKEKEKTFLPLLQI